MLRRAPSPPPPGPPLHRSLQPIAPELALLVDERALDPRPPPLACIPRVRSPAFHLHPAGLAPPPLTCIRVGAALSSAQLAPPSSNRPSGRPERGCSALPCRCRWTRRAGSSQVHRWSQTPSCPAPVAVHINVGTWHPVVAIFLGLRHRGQNRDGCTVTVGCVFVPHNRRI